MIGNITILLGASDGPAIPGQVIASWAIIAALLAGALLLRSRLRAQSPGKLQLLVELLEEKLAGLVRDIVRSDPEPYIPLAQAIFVFIFAANVVGMLPLLDRYSPSADLAVAAALAVVVFVAVPVYGIRAKGLRKYLAGYLKPNPIMLPFAIIGELTRTLSLAVRLFGNMMSGQFLLSIIVFVVAKIIRANIMLLAPVGMVGLGLMLFISVLSLITAIIQPLIFTILSLVYIGAAVERQEAPTKTTQSVQGETDGH